MFHVTIVESWEGAPASVPHETEYRPSAGGGLLGPFSFVLTNYVDDFTLVGAQQEPSDQTELIVSASLASDHLVRRNPIISPKNSANWNTTAHALGHTSNTHTRRSSITPEKVAALKRVAGEGMTERTGRSQRLGGTKHYIKTLEYFARCKSGALLRMAAITSHQLAFERRQEQ